MTNRPAIPKAIKEEVMKEYSYMCAICGKGNPQLHHIDGENMNNVAMNLIPLCPNHHLIDQHNPTKKFEAGKLKLFRIYKDPTILSPQFHAIYERIKFLEFVDLFDFQSLHYKSQELSRFIGCLEMGKYYSEKLDELMTPPKNYLVSGVSSEGPYLNEIQKQNIATAELERYNSYIKQLKDNCIEITELIIELLRFQNWRVVN